MRHALALLALAVGCGPSQPPRDFLQEPVTDVAYTRRGNAVRFGSSLHDRPDDRASAVAQIEEAEDDYPSPSYGPIDFFVFMAPIQFGATIVTPFGTSESTATSYYDAANASVFLSWYEAGPVGDPSQEVFTVANIPYELANVRCGCESGLRH